jgi:hypothetical protein
MLWTDTETLCVSCHFRDEEALVKPHLPWWVWSWLRWEHAGLRGLGYPPAAMLKHAEREMPIFRKHCPPEVVAQLDAQHERLIPILRAKLPA